MGMLTLLAMFSCEKGLDVAGAAEGNSVLNVVTRSGESDAKVSYPITVYVMNTDGQCVRKLQLLTANDQLSMKLQPLTYNIYAIAGAADGDYSLPGQDDATATSEITLNEDATHGDLMSAKNTVTMSEEESSTLTLSLSRKVMHLESLVINNVPKSVDAVTVTLAPIYDNLLLNGEYSSTTGTQTVALTEQSDGTTWQNDDELFLLPSAGNATITVKFSRGGTVTSYAYSSPLALEANKHIRITGTFTGTDELALSGVITGATWNGTTTIEFNFDEEGSTTTGGGTTTDDNSGNQDDNGSEDDVMEGTAPAVGSIYKECYVISSTDDADYTFVTVIHKTEVAIDGSSLSEDELDNAIDIALPNFDINGITGWRLPTEAEIDSWSFVAIKNGIASIPGSKAMSTKYYYYQAVNGVKAFSSAANFVIDRDYTYGECLRPVTTLKFHKE